MLKLLVKKLNGDKNGRAILKRLGVDLPNPFRDGWSHFSTFPQLEYFPSDSDRSATTLDIHEHGYPSLPVSMFWCLDSCRLVTTEKW